jgi:beta-lactamase class A
MANIDLNIFKKVFTDLGLESPNMSASDYPITTKEYSCFMRALFSATYLTIEDSEYATALLSKCNFKDGIVSSIPKTVKIAHKFGEAGDPSEKQLHESAIIYLKDMPYLITIMTKGKDLNKLAPVIRQISSVVYQDMVSISNSAS